MISFENQNIEFKQEYVSDIRKEVIGFANADGGVVYVGIRKDGVVIGMEDPDSAMLQIVNSLKDSIAPDIMPFVKVQAEQMEGKHVVEIHVTTGTNRPYYLREKGLKPSGVYVRKGSSTQPMTEEGIREMIIENSGRSFESCRSMNQELTFKEFTAQMEARSIAIGSAQMKTLKLIGEDGLYTNLALLLSDQCETTIKVALFQGIDKEIFRDRKEFSGSILKQLEDVYEFIDLVNRTKASFSGLNTSCETYPYVAIVHTGPFLQSGSAPPALPVKMTLSSRSVPALHRVPPQPPPRLLSTLPDGSHDPESLYSVKTVPLFVMTLYISPSADLLLFL